MKLETLLDALEGTNANMLPYLRRLRQAKAFRARILARDAEKDKRIAELEAKIHHPSKKYFPEDDRLETGWKRRYPEDDNPNSS